MKNKKKLIKIIGIIIIILLIIAIFRPTWTPHIKGNNSISLLEKGGDKWKYSRNYDTR